MRTDIGEGKAVEEGRGGRSTCRVFLRADTPLSVREEMIRFSKFGENSWRARERWLWSEVKLWFAGSS